MLDLAEQIQEFIDFGAPPVTVGEALNTTNKGRSFRPVLAGWVNRRLLGTVVMAAAVAVLLFLLIFGFNSSPVAHRPVTPVGHSKTRPHLNPKPHPKSPARPNEPPTTI